MITQNELKKFLNYDFNTGVFYWNVERGTVRIGNVAGCLKNNGYLQIQINGKKYYSHRLAWIYFFGHIPNLEIDHINGNKTDNRISNLRLATSRQNKQNKKIYNSNNKTGYLGVSFYKKIGKFCAEIRNNNKKIHIGFFENPEDAYKEYLKAKRKLHKFCTI